MIHVFAMETFIKLGVKRSNWSAISGFTSNIFQYDIFKSQGDWM